MGKDEIDGGTDKVRTVSKSTWFYLRPKRDFNKQTNDDPNKNKYFINVMFKL